MASPADMPVRLSVIIPAHQAAAVLPLQLDALLGQGEGDHWEVVVVDNRSSDGTQAVVERYAAEHPRVRYLAAHEQANASYARNAGAAAARGRALAFIDADDVVAPGWLEAMDTALLRHDLVGGPLHYDRLNPAWAVDVRGPAQRDGFFYVDGGPPWPLLFAANLGVRKDRHEQVGGFDERLPWGGEDADYVWRLQAAGVSPHWAAGAVVNYRVRDRLRPLFRQAVGYGRSRWELHARFAEQWPSPPSALSRRRLLARALRRLPQARSRVGLGLYVFELGWNIGDRAGARLTGTPVGPQARPRMRILLVEPDLDDNGAIRVSLDRASRWSGAGAQVVLFAVFHGPPDHAVVPDGLVLTHATPSPATPRRAQAVGLLRLAKAARRADVLVAGREVGHGLVLAALAARLARRPLAVTVQSRPDVALQEYVHERRRGITSRALRSADLAVCVAGGIAPVLQRMGMPQARIRVVTNGVDVEAVRSAGSEEPRTDLPSVPFVVASGRLHRQKGFDLLLRAHARALEAGALRHGLVLIGEGPERAALERLAEDLRVSDTVVFAGFLDNPHAVVSRAALFVLPSRWEGYPLALVEALCLGVPAVAADCVSGPREIVENGRYGLLVPVEDERALASAIAAHLAAPAALSAAAAEAAAAAARRFDPAKAARQHLELLEDLAGRRTVPADG